MTLSIRAITLLVLLTAVGCGASNKRVTVTGKVTVAGKGPLTGGNIRFVSVADPNKIGGGQIKPDGTFEVPDAPVGECKVVIDNSHLDPSLSKAAAMPGVPMAGGIPGGGMKGAPSGVAAGTGTAKKEDKAKMADAPKGVDVPTEMSGGKADVAGQKFVRIDPAYAKAETTALKADVKSGANTFDFDVK